MGHQAGAGPGEPTRSREISFLSPRRRKEGRRQGLEAALADNGDISKRYYEGFQQQRDYFGRPTSTNCRLFYTPLREVDLRIDFIEDDQLDFINFPSSLTSLKLDIRNTTNKTLDMGLILFRCPLLEVFHVGQVGELRITGPIYLSDHDRRKPRALRSLVLRGVAYEQSCLEFLLSVTPRLQELKLIGLQSRSRSPRDRFEAMRMDSSRIYALIKKLDLPIDSFHFSVTDCAAYGTELRHKLYLYPRRPTEWSFWAQELEPYFMKELAMNTNNVTTLDVFWERINRHNWSSCGLFTSILQQLHQFLCSSSQLQSLKVANAAILLEAMDLHRRSGYIDPDCCVMFTRLAELEKVAVRPGIWACRGLRHLSIEVHSHHLFELTSPVHSRIIFGYISRVCPNLEELEINVPGTCALEPGSTKHTPMLFGRLDGGLCLLSRLMKLRTMKVVIQDHWEKSFGSRRDALSWIHSSGHDAKSRAIRQGVVAGWERGIEMERLTELERASRVAGSEGEMYWVPSVVGTLASGLIKQLEKLGLLSDVKNMVDEMDVDGYCCLPVLKLVSFGGEVAQAPEDALGLLDPKWFWS